MPQQNNSVSPKRKISETFLDFAHPLVEMLGNGAEKEQVDQALQIAAVIWNAVVFDSVEGTRKYEEQLYLLAPEDPLSLQIFPQMIMRKKMLFGDNRLLIGDFKLN